MFHQIREKDYKMSKKETFTLSYSKTTTRPAWGSMITEVEYHATHVVHGIENHYKIIARLRGLESGQVYLDGDSAVCINPPHPKDSPDVPNTNEETLIELAVIDLFDNKVN